MKTDPSLKDPLYWGMTELALEVAREAMNKRAEAELQALQGNKSLAEIHGQAIRDYATFEQLIGGAFDFLKRIGHPLRGIAVDMGSGTGVGASILSNRAEISQVYAVEFSQYFVEKVMPLVFAEFHAQVEKIQRVVSDFNRLDLPHGSVNLILDIDSFHHSENLDTTLKECARVLTWDGVIIAIDRAWPDYYTQEQLEEMLNRQLPDRLKEKYGIPLDQSFTRRDFGEHEYTIGQWCNFFERNGFDPIVFHIWHPPALNRIWLRIPTFDFSIALSSWLYRQGKRRLWAYGYAKRVLFVCTRKK
ncbi:MAG: class I SAM-dependent methyltransferase [Anaerolineales bacterium]|nr:class I SAM-dependent methyltransferase [Anaerolineales bacterium]MCX7609827.1 class I SAM-dependent methyltransferase [Anaerolineales bacterium]